ncbi:sugar ABC transporter substrate-binding protein [Propionibacteriaceae bacterium G1746]
MRRRTLLSAGIAAGAVTTLAACAPGSDQPQQSAPAPSASDVSTDIASLGAITLKVWDQEVRGPQDEAITALIAAFKTKYPNVTIDRVKQSFDDLKKQTALALSGNDVPDVLQVNNARADMGEFVKAGQLTDLSGYAAAYKWTDRFGASVLSKARYSTDGVTFGDGSLWGLPQTGEIVGIFYSAKKLAALGVQAPKTWDELTDALTKAQAAGEQPLVLGNLEKWPALHVFGPLQGRYVASDEIIKLGMGNKGASWTSAENLEALTALGDMAKDKWLGPSPNGLSYDAAWPEFTKGTGVMLIGGSWLAGDMGKVMGDDLHFMAPPAGKDGKVATTGGTGIPFAIPAKAKQPAAAAAYIDFITSADAMKIIAEKGGMPVLNTAELAPASGVNKEVYAAFDEVSTNGVLLPYLDYATPTFSDTAGNTLQELIGGQKNAQQAADALQKDYAEFTK